MKRSFFTIALILSALSLVLTSCNKSDDEDQDFKVSSYKLVIDGITATEVVGEISCCPDGFFTILGTAPDGTPIAINTSKIMVNETRSICSIKEESEDFLACVDNGGFNVGGTILTHFYSPVSGTATRTSTNDIEISGVLIKDDLTEHAFTLEATASLVSPVNCE